MIKLNSLHPKYKVVDLNCGIEVVLRVEAAVGEEDLDLSSVRRIDYLLDDTTKLAKLAY